MLLLQRQQRQPVPGPGLGCLERCQPACLLVFVTFVHFQSPRTCCRIVNNFIRLVLLVRLAGMCCTSAAAAAEFDNDSAPLFMSCVRHAQLLTLNSPGARITHTHTQLDREGDTSMFALPNQQSAQIAQLCHGPPLSPSSSSSLAIKSPELPLCAQARQGQRCREHWQHLNCTPKKGGTQRGRHEELPLKECAASCAQIMKSI